MVQKSLFIDDVSKHNNMSFSITKAIMGYVALIFTICFKTVRLGLKLVVTKFTNGTDTEYEMASHYVECVEFIEGFGVIIRFFRGQFKGHHDESFNQSEIF